MRKVFFIIALFFIFISNIYSGSKVMITGGYIGYSAQSDYHGAIFYSENGGETFETVWKTEKNNLFVKKIIYVKELKKYVAIASFDPNYYYGKGDFTVLISKDGKNWEMNEPSLNKEFVKYSPVSIVYGNGTFVASGPGSCILYSKDGIKWKHLLMDEKGSSYKEKLSNWEKKVKGNPEKTHYYDVMFINNKFLLTGSNGKAVFLDYKNEKLVFSDDTNQGKKSANTIVTDNKNTILLLGSHYNGYISTDSGKNWNEISAMKYYKVMKAVWVKDKFIAGCDNGKMIYSEDGITWEEAGIDKYKPYIIWDISVSNNKIYTARSYHNQSDILVSEDGESWKVKACKPLKDKEFMNIMCIYID